MIGMVFCFMVFSVTVYAGTVVHTDPYASHYLTCTSICEEKYGTAKTSGAVNPYNNYAAVVIYGQDNKSQGTTYSIESETVENAEARLPAVATVRGKDLKNAVTYHALTNTSGAFLDSFLEQLVYSIGR